MPVASGCLMPTRRSLLGGLGWTGAVGLLWLAASVAVAIAQTPPRLTGPVTDETGVLRSDIGRIEQEIAKVRRESGVQLWVLFVNTTDAQTAAEFTDGVARANSLGGNDALLVVALQDRTDQLWVSNGLPQITTDEITFIVANVLEPRLASGDYAGAVIAAADALGEAATGNVAGTPTGQPSGQPSAFGGLAALIPLLLIVAGVWLIWRRVGEYRTGRRTAEERDRRLGDLARRANALLVQTDEAVRQADAEIGFAEAQFGADEAQVFRQALDAARQELRAAFEIRQRLDDGTPEDAATREQMLQEIVTRCERAKQLVDRAMGRVRELRSLEQNLPAAVADARARIERLRARLPAATATVARLEPVASGSLAPIRGNAVEAEKRTADLGRELDAVQAAATKGDHAGAARRLQVVQAATGDTERLLDAIDRLDATVTDVRSKLDAQLDEAARSIAAARKAIGTGRATAGTQAGVTSQLAEADAELGRARSSSDGSSPDPVGAFQHATRADQLADSVAAGLRAEADRRARERSIALSTIDAARARIVQADAFLGSRHHGVERDARTRLTEAERLLDQARSTLETDPAAATEAARHAANLAEDAYRVAAADFDEYDQFGRPTGGGTDVLRAALPFLIPILLRGGGGWGGTRWGEPGGGGGWGGGGVFGGGGRSSGGVFGGGGFGGGRSGGGRW